MLCFECQIKFALGNSGGRGEVSFVALAAVKLQPLVCQSEDRLIPLGIININFIIVILSANRAK